MLILWLFLRARLPNADFDGAIFGVDFIDDFA